MDEGDYFDEDFENFEDDEFIHMDSSHGHHQDPFEDHTSYDEPR